MPQLDIFSWVVFSFAILGLFLSVWFIWTWLDFTHYSIMSYKKLTKVLLISSWFNFFSVLYYRELIENEYNVGIWNN